MLCKALWKIMFRRLALQSSFFSPKLITWGAFFFFDADCGAALTQTFVCMRKCVCVWVSVSVGTYSTTGALLSSFDAGDVYNSDTPPLDFPLFNFHSLSLSTKCCLCRRACSICPNLEDSRPQRRSRNKRCWWLWSIKNRIKALTDLVTAPEE